MRVCGGIGSGIFFSLFMVSACYWRGRLCFGRGRDRGFVSITFKLHGSTVYNLSSYVKIDLYLYSVMRRHYYAHIHTYIYTHAHAISWLQYTLRMSKFYILSPCLPLGKTRKDYQILSWNIRHRFYRKITWRLPPPPPHGQTPKSRVCTAAPYPGRLGQFFLDLAHPHLGGVLFTSMVTACTSCLYF